MTSQQIELIATFDVFINMQIPLNVGIQLFIILPSARVPRHRVEAALSQKFKCMFTIFKYEKPFISASMDRCMLLPSE